MLLFGNISLYSFGNICIIVGNVIYFVWTFFTIALLVVVLALLWLWLVASLLLFESESNGTLRYRPTLLFFNNNICSYNDASIAFLMNLMLEDHTQEHFWLLKNEVKTIESMVKGFIFYIELNAS